MALSIKFLNTIVKNSKFTSIFLLEKLFFIEFDSKNNRSEA